MGLWSDEEERLKKAFFRWLEIREQETGEGPGDRLRLRIDVDKSCLLRRLCDGKEPFPEPPPVAYSAPWYEALEKGYVEASDVTVMGPGDWEGHVLVNQSFWKIETTNGERDFTCRYVIGLSRGKPRLSQSLWHVRFDRNLGRGIPDWDDVWSFERLSG